MEIHKPTGWGRCKVPVSVEKAVYNVIDDAGHDAGELESLRYSVEKLAQIVGSLVAHSGRARDIRNDVDVGWEEYKERY